MKSVSDLVAKQYGEYAYPVPVMDIVEEIHKGNYQQGDPSQFTIKIWPEGRATAGLDILVAGCGTNQAAWLAFSNPSSFITGIDLSTSSLQHEKYLQDRHSISNLELLQGNILEVGDAGKSFDLIVCTGVLHHMRSPEDGLRALSQVLRPGGAIFAALYSDVCRAGIYVLQELFRDLGIAQNRDGLETVRQTLKSLSPRHPASAFLDSDAAGLSDTELVDLFLHVEDQPFSVPGIISLVRSCGLEFQAWDDNGAYYPESSIPKGSPLRDRIDAMPTADQWHAVDRIRSGNSMHTFIACRPERYSETVISTRPQDWAAYFPVAHPHMRFEKDRSLEYWLIKRNNASFLCDEKRLTFLRMADGRLSINELCKVIASQGLINPVDIRDVVQFYITMYQRGHIFVSKVRSTNQ